MWKYVLFVIGLYWCLLGVAMWFAPMLWFEITPGVSATGGYNVHFIRDIALVFLVAGFGTIYSATTPLRHMALVAVAWPSLHALFHIWIWFHRGTPADLTALSNLIGIQLPALLALIAVFRHTKPEEVR